MPLADELPKAPLSAIAEELHRSVIKMFRFFSMTPFALLIVLAYTVVGLDRMQFVRSEALLNYKTLITSAYLDTNSFAQVSTAEGFKGWLASHLPALQSLNLSLEIYPVVYLRQLRYEAVSCNSDETIDTLTRSIIDGASARCVGANYDSRPFTAGNVNFTTFASSGVTPYYDDGDSTNFRDPQLAYMHAFNLSDAANCSTARACLADAIAAFPVTAWLNEFTAVASVDFVFYAAQHGAYIGVSLLLQPSYTNQYFTSVRTQMMKPNTSASTLVLSVFILLLALLLLAITGYEVHVRVTMQPWWPGNKDRNATSRSRATPHSTRTVVRVIRHESPWDLVVRYTKLFIRIVTTSASALVWGAVYLCAFGGAAANLWFRAWSSDFVDGSAIDAVDQWNRIAYGFQFSYVSANVWIAILLLLAARALAIMRYLAAFTLLTVTIERSIQRLAALALLFAAVLVCFIVAGCVLFPMLSSFSTVSQGFETLLLATMSASVDDATYETARSTVAGGIYLLSFYVIEWMILLNVVVGIFTETIEASRGAKLPDQDTVASVLQMYVFFTHTFYRNCRSDLRADRAIRMTVTQRSATDTLAMRPGKIDCMRMLLQMFRWRVACYTSAAVTLLQWRRDGSALLYHKLDHDDARRFFYPHAAILLQCSITPTARCRQLIADVAARTTPPVAVAAAERLEQQLRQRAIELDYLRTYFVSRSPRAASLPPGNESFAYSAGLFSAPSPLDHFLNTNIDSLLGPGDDDAIEMDDLGPGRRQETPFAMLL